MDALGQRKMKDVYRDDTSRGEAKKSVIREFPTGKPIPLWDAPRRSKHLAN